MKKFLVVLLLGGAAAVPAYQKFFAGRLGISPEHPLGDFESLDARLLEDGESTRSEAPMRHADCALPGWKAFEYVDVDKSYRTRVNNVVTVMTDPSGKVRAIATQFESASKKAGFGSSRSEALTLKLWEGIGGPEPSFVEQVYGSGEGAEVHLVATFLGPHAHATWRKIYLDNYNNRSIVDTCIFHTADVQYFREAAWGSEIFPGKSAR